MPTRQPRITVIIPTRERADVLRSSLRTVVDQDYDGLEILVSDNASTDDTRGTVLGFNDARIKYLNTGRRIGMAQNWEFALSNVTGDWVAVIGDDDGLLPGTIKRIAAAISDSGVQAIRTEVCTYHWPSMTGRPYGRLTVPLRSGQELRNCREWQSKVMAGKCDYKQLPMLYNGGYVSMAALNQIKARTGAYYRSCIPDLYSAMTLSSILDVYLYMFDVSAINGASKHSTGTSQFSANASQASSPAARFAAEGNLPFHSAVPMNDDGSYPASIQALAYESYLQSASLRPPALHSIADLQLELVLASAGPRASRVRDWGRKFAEVHHLDFDKISAKARVKKIGMDAKAVWAVVSTVAGAWTDGSPEHPIVDVHAAGLAANAILAKKPGLLQRWLRLTRDLPRLFDYLFVYLRRV